jgi:hypothetical protein
VLLNVGWFAVMGMFNWAGLMLGRLVTLLWTFSGFLGLLGWGHLAAWCWLRLLISTILSNILSNIVQNPLQNPLQHPLHWLGAGWLLGYGSLVGTKIS